MSRLITDENLLIWEAYPSGGRFGAVTPHVVFHCLSNRAMRPRFVIMEGDEADAERTVLKASNEQLLEMLRKARPVT